MRVGKLKSKRCSKGLYTNFGHFLKERRKTMRVKVILGMFLVGAFSTLNALTHATTYTLDYTKVVCDGYVEDVGGSLSEDFDGDTLVAAAKAWWNKDRILLKWDLSGIPTGLEVTSATLTLYLKSTDGSHSHDVMVWPVVDPAEHGVSNANDWNDSATYNDAQTDEEGSSVQRWYGYGWKSGIGWTWDYGNIEWADNPDIESSITINADDPQGKRCDWDVTEAVNKWLNEGYANYGFIISNYGWIGGYPTSTLGRFEFYSSEYSDKNMTPLLTIELVPEPATTGLTLLGLIGLVSRKR